MDETVRVTSLCDNWNGAGGAGNTARRLTHPLDASEGGLAVKATRFKECSVDGCESKSRSRGMCRKHYHRVLNHGTTDSLRPRDRICSVADCSTRHFGLGYCMKHY